MYSTAKYIEVPREGNDWWPLPPNWHLITDEDERRKWRVNACSMQGKSVEDAVASWAFFCNEYLYPDPEAGFDPGFYDPPVLAAAPIHSMMVRIWEGQVASGCSFPRGSGKSTTFRSFCIWKLVTNPGFLFNFVKLKDEFCIEDIQRVRRQIEKNARIVRDFGSLRSTKGEGVWNNHQLALENGAWLRSFGVMSGKRGPRAHFVALDDVEKDAQKSTDMSIRRGEVQKIVQTVLMPMLMTTDSHITIVGTEVHKQSFLHVLVSTPDDELTGEDEALRSDRWYKISLVAKDPRKNWNAWPAKFTDEFLESRRRLMGERNFGREFEGRTVGTDAPVFVLWPAMHEYTVEDTTDGYLTDPWNAGGLVRWHECGRGHPVPCHPRHKPWSEFLGSLFIFITVDYAYTQKSTSDWSVIHVLGLDSKNDLFSLDMWRGKVPFTRLIDLIWQYAMRWRAKLVGVEAYPVQEEYFHRVAGQGEFLRQQGFPIPACMPIQPHQGLSKGQKIMRLDHRFLTGKIKLPGHRRRTDYQNLYYQIENFEEEVESALKHDDEIDTLAMSVDVLKGSPRIIATRAIPQTPLEKLAAGETHDEDGFLWASKVNFQQVPVRDLDNALANLRESRYTSLVGDGLAETDLLELGGVV